LVTENRLRVTIQGPDNKSLDASGFSGLVIDNLSVTQLSPAASTQPFGSFRSFQIIAFYCREQSSSVIFVRLSIVSIYGEDKVYEVAW
jgi:hypothetical protein